MQKKNIYLISILVLFVVVLGGAYFIFHKEKQNVGANNLSPTQQITISQDTILLAQTKSLEFFTDANGMTLYHDAQDWPKNTKPPYSPYTKCTGSCVATWTPFYTDSIKISAPLKADDFTTFSRPDGKKQIAYRGWPLYYYTGDNKPGDINGQGIGNIWYAGVSTN